MLDDCFGLLGMIDVILHAIDEVAVVVLDNDVVVVGDQCSLTVPGLVFWQRHYSQGVGRHDPLEVCGHIIALDAEDKLVGELLFVRHESLDPFGMVFIVILIGLAKVAHRMIEILLEQEGTLRLLANDVAAHGAILLFGERELVIDPLEMTEGIELEDNRIGHFADRTRLDEEGVGIFIDDVAIEIRHTLIAGKTADGLIEVDEIAAVAILGEPWELEVTQEDELRYLALSIGILGREHRIAFETAVVFDSILHYLFFGGRERGHQTLHSEALNAFRCEIMDVTIEIIGDSRPAFTSLTHLCN